MSDKIKKVKEVAVYVKDGVKNEIAREVAGLWAFAEYSPWCFGRYVTFEAIFLVLYIYALKTGKKLDWVDPD